jgi:hypothetical protein
MVIFNEEDGRKFERKGVLGLHSIVIQDDVNIGDAVMVGMNTDNPDNRYIVIYPTAEAEDTDELGERIHVLAKEFGVFGGIENEMDIIISDNGTDQMILFELLRGALIMKNPENGELMMVHRGVDNSKIGNVDVKKVKWLDGHQLIGFLQYYNKYGHNYCMDYMSTVVITSESALDVKVRHVESLDLSCGGFSILDQRNRASEQRKQVIQSSDDFDDDEDYDYDDDEDDDDFEDLIPPENENEEDETYD